MDTTSVALSSFAARLALCALAASAASSASLGQCGGYAIASSTGGVITPGASDTGNHGDDLATALTLPFTVSLYGNWYNAVQVVSNGSLQFTTAGSNPVEYANECLAAPTRVTGVTLFPLWDDLRTDVTIGGVPGGVYTSVTGTPGSRVFNVEWRASYYGNDAARVSFEVRLFEDQSRIEFVYGDIPDGGASATIGVQSAPGTFTQFSCNAAGVSSGRVLTLTPTGPAAALCAAGGVSPARVNSCGGGPALMMVHVSPATSPASTGV
ncbi:MAG: hypothetical protein K2Q09_10155, partial [Phycisphaerales bacterium]|nr:hypothetical protein [Phycisphaerales bacterium]